MKFLIIDYYYPEFLNTFYNKNSNIDHKNYNELKKIIFDYCFGTANFYSTNLTKLGHITEEIIFNNEILQRQWAKEHGIKFFNGLFNDKLFLNKFFKLNWKEKILKEQIKEFKPDVIYCQNLKIPGNIFLKKIKKLTKLIVGQIACPTVFDKKLFSEYDLILTSFPHYVERFKEVGINSEYFKIGFEASILDKLKESDKKYNVVFVGGISKHHTSAIETFEYLAENTKIDFWGYGKEQLSSDSPIIKNHRGEAWGIDMYNILFNSKISINRHIDAAENFANNMRLYESTGVGAMLITDYKDNLNELFEIGREIETYKSKEELLDKINYYLTHEDKRQKIALAGQARTLKDHNYGIRMKELINILNKYL